MEYGNRDYIVKYSRRRSIKFSVPHKQLSALFEDNWSDSH